MKADPSKDIQFDRFEGVDELLAYLEREPVKLTKAQKRDKVIPASEWARSAGGMDRGFESFDAALAIARHGWPEGLAHFRAIRDLIETPAAVFDYSPQPTIGEEGDEVLVDRYLDGDSDCWLAFPYQQSATRSRVLSVVLHVGGLGDVKAESFYMRGAAALALTDAAEAAGLRVELWVSTATLAGFGYIAGKTHAFLCCVKRAEDSIDLDRMAFFLCSPAVLRRFVFRLREIRSFAGWKSACYGHTYTLPVDLRPHGEDSIFLDAPKPNQTPAEHAREIAKILDRYTEEAPA